MDSPVDNTAVIRMQKDFSDSGRRIEQPTLRLNLDDDDFPACEQRPAISDESIKAALEKEKQEKLRAAELLAAQSKIAELETLLASAKTSNKRSRIEFEKDLDSLKSERERNSEKISKLRRKLQWREELEQLAKAKLAVYREDWETARISLEKKLCNVQRENLTIEGKLQEVKEEYWQQLLEQTKESDRCRKERDLMVIELEKTKEQLNLEKGHLEELTETLKDYEDLKKTAESAEEKIKDLEEQIGQQAEDAAVTRVMRSDINKVPGLEKEVNRLRFENEYWSVSQQKQKAMLQQERLISLQRKLDTAEKRCEAFAQLHVEHEDLKSRLLRWEAMDTSGSRRHQYPSALSRRVKELQTNEAVALEQKVQLQLSITMMELQLREVTEQQKKAQGQLSTQQVQVEQQNDLIKRLQRKLLLVSKERDSFKQILDSYENEVAIPVDNRIKELQEMLGGYQQHNSELESQMDRLSQQRQQTMDRCLQLEQQCQASQAGSSASLKADLDKIGQLQEQPLEAEQVLQKMTEEKEVLEMMMKQRNLQGDYNPRHTEVLYMLKNPAAMAQQQREQEMERLREENEQLTTRVQLWEQAGG